MAALSSIKAPCCESFIANSATPSQPCSSVLQSSTGFSKDSISTHILNCTVRIHSHLLLPKAMPNLKKSQACEGRRPPVLGCKVPQSVTSVGLHQRRHSCLVCQATTHVALCTIKTTNTIRPTIVFPAIFCMQVIVKAA